MKRSTVASMSILLPASGASNDFACGVYHGGFGGASYHGAYGGSFSRSGGSWSATLRRHRLWRRRVPTAAIMAGQLSSPPATARQPAAVMTEGS